MRFGSYESQCVLTVLFPSFFWTKSQCLLLWTNCRYLNFLLNLYLFYSLPRLLELIDEFQCVFNFSFYLELLNWNSMLIQLYFCVGVLCEKNLLPTCAFGPSCDEYLSHCPLPLHAPCPSLSHLNTFRAGSHGTPCQTERSRDSLPRRACPEC